MKHIKSPAACRLREAIKAGRIFQTRLLLEDGADLQFVDEEGLSPILCACKIDETKRRTRSSLLRLLIQHGADVNATDPQGRHALIVGCISESADIIRLLLDTSIHNIDLNLKDNDGNTALMHAVRSGNIEIVRLLVDALNMFELNIDVRNYEDYTPYLEAKRLGNEECAHLLATVGHASKNIEVNPFLDFMDVREKENGKMGGVRSEAYIKESNKQRDFIGRQTKRREIPSCRTKHTTNGHKKRTYEEKTQLSRKSDVKLKGNTEMRQFYKDVKLAWNDEPVIKVSEEDAKQLSKGRGNTKMVENMNNSTGGNKCDTEMSPQLSRYKRMLSVEDVTFSHAHPRPSLSAGDFPKGSDITDIAVPKNSPRSNVTLSPKTKDIFPATPQETFFVTSFSNQMSGGPRTAAMKNIRSPSVDDSDVSWHTHFSTQTNPSAVFIHRVMNIYAEQVSPQSSYRSGVRHSRILAPETVSEDADDHHSDDRRSSCCSRSGSIRGSSLGRASSRKFSKTVATFLNNKRAMATVAMLRSGVKDGGTV